MTEKTFVKIVHPIKAAERDLPAQFLRAVRQVRER